MKYFIFNFKNIFMNLIATFSCNRMKLEEAIRNESKSKTTTGEATVTGEGRVTGEGTVTAYDNPAYVETE